MEHRLVIKGLKCDNPKCDYIDNNSPDMSQYHNYVNTKCPKCGENLLTYEAYEQCFLLYHLDNAKMSLIEAAKIAHGIKSDELKCVAVLIDNWFDEIKKEVLKESE